MQGVGYIKSAKLWYSRALWAFLLLVAIGWMVFHLFYLISQFLELPIQTKISLGFNNLQFPAVTLCNMNAVKWSRLPDTPLDLQEIVAKTDPDQFNPGADVPGKVIAILTLKIQRIIVMSVKRTRSLWNFDGNLLIMVGWLKNPLLECNRSHWKLKKCNRGEKIHCIV